MPEQTPAQQPAPMTPGQFIDALLADGQKCQDFLNAAPSPELWLRFLGERPLPNQMDRQRKVSSRLVCDLRKMTVAIR